MLKSFFLSLLIFSPVVLAETDVHHEHELVYVDPLGMEHAFLEKKLRFDFSYENRADFERQNDEAEEGTGNVASYGVVFEWILHERVGFGVQTALLQVDAFENSNTVGFGNTEFELKLLPWIDEERDFIAAVSFGLGLPTGNEEYGLGEGRIELEPGILLFKKVGDIVLQGQYNYVVELGSGQESTFFKYNHSLSFPISIEDDMLHSIVPIFEILGSLPLNGESEGENQIRFLPGVRANFAQETSVGLGFNFPVGRYSDNEAEVLVTISKHFD